MALGVAVAVIGLLAVLWGDSIVAGRRMTHVAPTLAGVTAALWFVMVAVESRLRGPWWGFTPLFAGLALAASLLILGPKVPGAVTGSEVRGWSTYHYYVGSKYFPDTGFFDLYAATLVADDRFQAAGGDPKEGWGDAERARDMRTYSLRPRAEIAATFDAASMDPDRLEELGRDSRFFRNQEHPKNRHELVLDLGYNPGPPWLLLGRPITELIDPGGPGFSLITVSDLAMHVVLFAALWWGFGLRVACIALLWLLTMGINRNRLVGGFFNYDWLAASGLALAAWKRERPELSALALSWAAMTRVFPGLMALPLVYWGARDVLKGRSTPRRRFTTVFVAACAVLFVASHTTGRGLQTWPEWAEKISIHSHHHARTGAKRVGLGKLVRHQPSETRFFRAPRNQGKARNAQMKVVKRVGIGLGLLLLLPALRRRKELEAMLLMLFLSFLLTTSSRYYASIWLLLLVLPTAGARASPGRLAGGFLMGMLAFFYLPPGMGAQYLVLNYAALAMFVSLCALYLVRDARAGRGPNGGGMLATGGLR